MSIHKKRADFFTSQEGVEAFEILTAMADSDSYHTESTYSANTALYSDNLISFVDKHMIYLQNHPSTDPLQYISNLKLMTRLRTSIYR